MHTTGLNNGVGDRGTLDELLRGRLSNGAIVDAALTAIA